MYDVLFGMNEVLLNRLVADIYGRASLRKQIFEGTQEIAGIGKVEWAIQSAPTFRLSKPTSEQWANAIGVDGNAPAPTEQAFFAEIRELSIPVISAPVKLDIICSAALNGEKLKFNACGVVMDMSRFSEFDKMIFKMVLIPAMLKAISTVLSSGCIPPLSFQGLSFGTPQMCITNEQLCVYAALRDNGTPTPPVNVPKEPFLLQLSMEAEHILIKHYISQLNGLSKGDSGKKDFYVGEASYKCNVTVNSVEAQRPTTPLALSANVTAQPSASARLKLLFVPLDIGYEGSISPDPLNMSLSLGFNGNTLRATVADMKSFNMLLTPTGNIASKIISGVAWPLSELMVTILAPSLKQMLKGRAFDLYTIQAQSFSILGERITLTPQDLKMREWGNMLSVSGTF